MSRRALIRKRCTSCGATIPEKACPKGHRSWTWSFTVDVNPQAHHGNRSHARASKPKRMHNEPSTTLRAPFTGINTLNPAA